MESAIVKDFVPATGNTVMTMVGGHLIATSHGADKVGLWDLETGTLYAEFSPDAHSPVGLRFTNDGRYLYYDTDNVLRRYPIDDADLLQLAKDRVTRQLTSDECNRYEIECLPAA
jgi:hypothetical protein